MRTANHDRLPADGGDPPNARCPITVIVLTYNEALNIRSCLRGLEWADDVVLVDSFSTDDTVLLARQTRPDIRVFQHKFEDFGKQRNWAIDHTEPRHPWLLMLDADERCTRQCALAIQKAVQSPGDHIGFFLTYRNIFLGKWVKRTTMFPSWQLRLLKRGSVRFRREGHGQREVADGALGYIDEPYDHHGFSKGIAEWIERHNRYSTDEIDLIQRHQGTPTRLAELFHRDAVVRRRCLKRLAARTCLQPWMRFLYVYVFRGGFLDGRAGLLFCLLRLAHDIHIVVKLAEATHRAAVERAEQEPHPVNACLPAGEQHVHASKRLDNGAPGVVGHLEANLVPRRNTAQPH